MIKNQLSKEHRQELEKFCRQALDRDSEKALMLLMNSDGETVQEIVSDTKV